MSRVGKNPVEVPQGVTIDVAGGAATVKGKLGTLKLPISTSEVEVKFEDGKVWVKPLNESKQARMSWGATRANLRNMVEGVSKGYVQEPGDHRHRLSRGGAGQEPAAADGLQPRCDLPDPGRHRDQV